MKVNKGIFRVLKLSKADKDARELLRGLDDVSSNKRHDNNPVRYKGYKPFERLTAAVLTLTLILGLMVSSFHSLATSAYDGENASAEVLAEEVAQDDLLAEEDSLVQDDALADATEAEENAPLLDAQLDATYIDASEEGIIDFVPFAGDRPLGMDASIPIHTLATHTRDGLNTLIQSIPANTEAAIRITADINITVAGNAAINIAGGRIVHIFSDVDGPIRTINRSAGTNRNFDVQADAQLHLWDVTVSQSGQSGTSNRGGMLVTGATAQLHLHAGSTVTGFSRTAAGTNGGAVLVSGANARLYMFPGSTIRNSTARNNGGGVAITGTNARFYMYGGEIRNNDGQSNGGGVYVGAAGAHFTIRGGEIHTNTGHGIFVTSGNVTIDANSGAQIRNNTSYGIRLNGGTINMHDGEIHSHTTRGVRLAGGHFHMHGGSIRNNAGGVLVDAAAGDRMTMNGGRIEHNAAAGRGGGINIDGGTVTLNANAVIDNNTSNHASDAGTSSGGGGGVSINSGGTASRLNVNNATISNNRALRGHGGGIQVAAGTAGSAAVLYINSIRLLNNQAHRNAAGTQGGNGGGIHSNTNATFYFRGVIIMEGNIAYNGGAMRVFSGSAANFTLAAGSRIVNNIARRHTTPLPVSGNGAGISIAHSGTSDANVIGLRVEGTADNPVIFEGNRAINIGGAIHHEGPNMGETRGVRIEHARFINNRASDGGAISLVLTDTNNNNLPANAATNRLRISNTTFEGNSATNGLLVDENLAARNVGNEHFVNGQVGSVVWYGPRTDINGNVLEVETRNHIWNNYDVITRNRLEARNLYYDSVGDVTAAANSDMNAELTHTVRSANPTTTTVGLATPAPHLIAPPNAEGSHPSGGTAISGSQATVRLTTIPWNAYVRHWTNTQITRSWYGDPVTGHPEENVASPVVIANSANQMVITGIQIGNHTRIQAHVYYITHDITFNANPSTPTSGGTVGGTTTVTRTLRQSRSAADHAGYTGVTPRGEPIGAPPVTAARDNWVFVGWSGPIVDSNGDPLDTTGMTIPERIAAQEAAIAAMYVTEPMTFVANFELRTAHAITLNPGNETRGNSGYVIYTATVVDQFGDPMPNQNSFVINWTTSASQYVTINNTNNPAGQPNTTTATVTVAAPAGSSSTITATLASDTSISASAVVSVALSQIATAISVTPASNYVFRNRSVGLTAVVLDQFGNPMPNQESFEINWASTTLANVTINPTSNAAGQANTTTATATAGAVMGSNNNVTATLAGTSIVGTAVVTIGTTFGLEVSYRARNTPVGMTVTVEGNVIAANTGAAVATHQVIPDDAVALFSGTAPNQTFLGWRTHEEYLALPTNSYGNRFIPGFVAPAATTSNFNMPTANRHMVALWGNQDGDVSVYNHVDVTFNANHGATPATATRRITLNDTYAAAMAHADVVALESRTGFVFGGWFTSAALANGTTQDGRVLPTTIVTNANNHTLFARWVARTDIQVTFNANHGATPATATHNVTFESTYAAAMGQTDVIALQSRTGFNFGGWFTSAALAAGTTQEGRVLPETIVTNANDHTLFARWTERTGIQVTFNANHGATPATSTQDVTFLSTYAAAMSHADVVALVNRTGFIFGGWFVSQEAAAGTTDAGRVLPTTTVTNADDHTLFARWTARTDIAVTFNANHGATPATATHNVTFGGTYAAAMGQANVVALHSRTGFNFGGWFVSQEAAAGTTDAGRVEPGTEVTNADDHILFARWIARSDIAVTFNANHGATPATVTHNVTFEGTYEAAMNQPDVLALHNRTGFNFDGWFTTAALANGDTQEGRVLPGDIVTNANNHTLFARWTAQTGIQVTFNANHGTTPATTTQGVTFGGTYAAAMSHINVVNLESRTGFNFGGWFTSAALANGTTEEGRVLPGTTVTNASSHTLYARWAARTDIQVTFNANHGATPATATHNVTFGGTYAGAMSQGNVTALESRTGFNFGGWFTSVAYANGTTQDGRVLSTTTVTNAENHTLYARWTARTDIQVTFNANHGATPATATHNVTFGGTYAAAMGQLDVVALESRTGFNFGGWFTSAAYANGTTQDGRVLSTTTVTNADDHTLFARWTARTDIQVTFNATGGTPTSQVQYVTFLGTYAAAMAAITQPTQAGWVFQGWFTAAQGGVRVLPGTQVTRADDHMLFAQWERSADLTDPVVRFFRNDGSATQVLHHLVTVRRGDTVVPPITPTRAGYVFNGWTTTAAGGTPFNFSAAITTDTNVYAQWTAAPSTPGNDYVRVDFLWNTTSTDEALYRQVNIARGTRVGLFANPTRTNYTFLGWSTVRNDANLLNEFNFAADMTANVTPVYAQWSRDTVRVYFDSNGGTPVMPQMRSADIGGTYAATMASLIHPTFTGWVFQGWFTAPVGGARVLPTDTVVRTDTHTLYAQWERSAGPDDPVVRFWRNDGSATQVLHHLVTLRSGDTVVPPITPTRAGYVFNGWTTTAAGGTPFNFSAAITTNTNVYAQWTAAPSTPGNDYVRVDFLWNTTSTDESLYRQVNIARGTRVGLFAIPTRTNYTFLGWSTVRDDSALVSEFNFAADMTANVTRVYAQWSRDTVRVYFDSNGGMPVVPQMRAVDIGGTYAASMASLAQPTNTGFVFQGWFTARVGGLRVMPTDLVVRTDTHTLYAQWERSADLTDPVVRFFRNDGSVTQVLHHLVTVHSGDTVVPPITPTRAGHVFNGWTTTPAGGVPFNFAAPITTDTNAYAQWTAAPSTPGNDYVRVDFLWNTTSTDESLYRQVNIARGTAAGLFANPTREHYTFVGWSTVRDDLDLDHEFNFATLMTANVTPIYAQWSANMVTVTFNSNGGEPFVPQTRAVQIGGTYAAAMSAITEPTRTGFVFQGWYTASVGGLRVQPGYTVTRTYNHTLHAQWERSSDVTDPVVRFFRNDGSAIQVQHYLVTVRSGDTVVPPITPTRAGYVFNGWTTTPAGGTPFNFAAPITTDTNVYAQWTAAPSTPGNDYVRVDFLRNTTSTDESLHRQVNIARGTTVDLFANPTRAHFTFVGWSTVRNDLDLVHEFNFATEMTANVTSVYAQWSANMITVTFNSNGGDPFVPQTRAVQIGGTYAAAMSAITEPTRTGFVFQGWFTASVGGLRVIPGDTVTRTEDHTLFAQWERSADRTDPVVRFWRNDGTPQVLHHLVTVHSGDTVVPPITPTRAGHVFNGWTTTAAGGTPFNFAAPITADTNAYAQWTAAPSTPGNDYVRVDFLWNTTSTDESLYRQVNIARGTTVGLFANPTRAHFTFVGWSTERNDLDLVHEFNFATEMTANVTSVYAQWSANMITVTFNSNGGDPAVPQTRAVQIGGTYAAAMSAIAEPTRTGWVFQGWYTTAVGGARVQPGDTVTRTEDHTLFAQWERSADRVDPVVRFWRNDGSATQILHHLVTVRTGDTVVPPITPTRAGYVFNGWTTTAAGGPAFDFAAPITTDTNAYAQWTAAPSTPGNDYVRVDFLWNTTSTDESSYRQVNIARGTTVGLFANPTRAHHTFVGWSTERNDLDLVHEFNFATEMTANVTSVYAQWSANMITVTFNSNGGDPFVPQTRAVQIGGTYAAAMSAITEPVRTGFVFQGWFTASVGGERVQPGYTVTRTEDHTLFAQWERSADRVDPVVSFWRNDGSATQVLHHLVTVRNGDTVVPPITPTRAGYVFNGWTTTAAGGTAFSFSTAITANTDVYAQWTAAPSTPGNDYVRVDFLWNTTSTDESLYRQVNIARGTTVGLFANPTRAHYTFVGWSTVRNDLDLVHEFNFATEMTANVTSVYAQWSANMITVTFNSNGGDPFVPQTRAVQIGGTYAAAMSAITEPTRTGFVFQGWFTAAVGGERVQPGYTVTRTEDHTLFAQWERSADRVDPVVSFWRNDGSATQVLHHLVTVRNGDTVVPPITPTRAGYVFNGWTTTAAGGTAFSFSTAITANTDVYAQWTAEPNRPGHDYVRVDFLWNTTSIDDSLYRQVNIVRDTTTGLFANPTRAHYTFVGWSTVRDDLDLDHEFDFATAMGVDVTPIYAQWIANMVTVTFNSNGGEPFTPQVRDIQIGTTYAAAMSAITEPTRDGWVFQGWFTAAVGGLRVIPGDTVTRTYDHTLFAQWERSANPDDPVVRFWRNDGTPQVLHHLVTLRSGDTVVPPITPTRAGYVFDEWTTTAAGGTAFDFSAPITADTNVYAQWTAAPSTPGNDYVRVDFLWNRSSTDDTLYRQVNIVRGTRAGLFADPARAHYTFVGWSTVRDDVDLDHEFDFAVAVTADVTSVYAQWVANMVTVTFNSNGGAPFTPQTRAVQIGGTYAAAMSAITEPTRDGWIFQGWFTAAVGGARVQPGYTVTRTYDHTLFAQWERSAGPNDPVVRFWRNDGSATQVLHHLVTLRSGDTVVPPITPTRAGYVFDEWTTTAAGGTAFDFSTPITADTNVYAQWTAAPSTPGNDYVRVDFLWNRSSTDDTLYRQVNIVRGTRAGLFADPTRDHYTFVGWSTVRDDLDLDHEFDFATQLTADVTSVYAQWSANAVAVTFNSNGGAPFVPQIRNIQLGTTYAAAMSSITEPTRTGWVFQGWYTATEGGVRVQPGDIVTRTYDHTLFAQWERSADRVDPVVSFWRNDGSATQVLHHLVTVRNGDTVVPPITPTRAGYVFNGWTTTDAGGTPFDFSAPITANTDAYAQWTAAPSTPGNDYVRVDFLWNTTSTDESLYRQVNIVRGTTAGLFANPTRAHYTFVGWSTVRDDLDLDHEFDFATQLTADVTSVYAQWNANMVTVTFNSNGGAPFTPQVRDIQIGTTYESAMSAITEPTRTDFVFQGWFTAAVGGVRVQPGYTVVRTYNHTLFAQWERSADLTDPVVSFWRNDGSATQVLHHLVTVRNNDTVVPPITPTRAGYVFNGWTTTAAGGTPFDFSAPITANTDAYAQWTAAPSTPGNDYVRVDFLRNTTSTDESLHRQVNIVRGTTAGLFANPTRAHYTFVGWSTERDDLALSDAFNFAAPVTDDVTRVYAQWSRNTVNVTFAANGGTPALQTAVAAVAGPYSVAMNAITQPTRTGWVFQGWFTTPVGGTHVQPTDIVVRTDAHTLYAQWERGASIEDSVVRFWRNDGSATQVLHHLVTVRSGDTVVPPITPTRDDYVFAGWYTNAGTTTAFNFNTGITADVDLYARWTPDQGRTQNDYVEVDFLWNFTATDANVYRSVRIARDTQVGLFADPLRTHYRFVGWSTVRNDVALNNEFSFSSAVTSDTTVYAQWARYVAPTVHKSATEQVVIPGGTLGYEIMIRNNSTLIFEDRVTIEDVLDERLIFVPGSVVVTGIGSTAWSYTWTAATRTLRVTLTHVPTGDVAIRFNAEISEEATGTNIGNTALLRDSDGNIIGEGSHNVELYVRMPEFEAEIEKRADRRVTLIGNPINYTITVTNISYDPLVDFVVVDELDTNFVRFAEGTLLVNGVPTPNATHTNGVIQVNLGTMLPGDVVVITFGVVVLRQAVGQTIYNVAVVSHPDDGRWEASEEVVVSVLDIKADTTHHAYLIGYRDGTVRPNANISRAEVATIFFRLISDDYRAEIWSQQNPFSDVALESWYNNSISTMANANFLRGYRDGTFRPGNDITRAEFATIVSRFMSVESEGGDRFSDISGHWAAQEINNAAYVGWVRGFPDGTFRPDNTITRAEAAAIINRIFLRNPETVSDLLPGMITWPDNANTNAWYYLHIQEATNSNYYEMKECGIYKRWTELITPRDWTVLQHPNSTPRGN